MEYGDERIQSSPMPTPRTLRGRYNIPYQLLRFLRLNFRMIAMVTKGHH
ncbi:MAG: hypothetical protein P8Z68_04230 [Kineosporiaceae bacterium]|jgi:hypothetical protein